MRNYCLESGTKKYHENTERYGGPSTQGASGWTEISHPDKESSGQEDDGEYNNGKLKKKKLQKLKGRVCFPNRKKNI